MGVAKYKWSCFDIRISGRSGGTEGATGAVGQMNFNFSIQQVIYYHLLPF